MHMAHATFSRYTAFRLLILLLLAGDAAVYTFSGRTSAALDAIAWLILLLLFEWETRLQHRWRTNWLATAIQTTRTAAILGIAFAAFAFLEESAWLDVANSALWIGVVVLLEFEVRFPLLVARYRAIFTTSAVALYGSLAALVLVWAWRREWLDAYDALIWLIAFAIIEMDVLKFSQRSAAESGAMPY